MAPTLVACAKTIFAMPDRTSVESGISTEGATHIQTTAMTRTSAANLKITFNELASKLMDAIPAAKVADVLQNDGLFPTANRGPVVYVGIFRVSALRKCPNTR